jgi:hypothetical protein
VQALLLVRQVQALLLVRQVELVQVPQALGQA